MKKTLLLLTIFSLAFGSAKATPQPTEKPAKKRVYMSFILHGNMNYDRYVITTLWRDFPVIYDNLLTFMDEHPDFKGQLQFSGQTLGSLKQAAPHVLDHAMRIHKRGQLNFTGTFYSEPVNVNMDGETNYRCALLGTRMVEDFLGEKTDGFYLQERAYHPQLPWILNNSNVSWTPIITNDESWRPFRLSGMDGSSSVCVPITRSRPLEKVVIAPENSLITIEEDYEIPQKFSRTYAQVAAFNAESQDTEIVWITVKEYIEKFGLAEERYIDHSAKANDLAHGTYSRWTADPLDIIIQDYTDKAMKDFRSANIFSALLRHTKGWNLDKEIAQSDVTTIDDPLAWNIERADLYPEVEPKFLTRDGKITTLSRSEHLLLWAVNSDSKGWYPLYEKRSERTTSLQNSSLLSESLIHDGMDKIAENIKLKGYDTYFMALSMEHGSKRSIALECDHPYAIYDYASGKSLNSHCQRTSKGYTIEFEAELPSFGYAVFGAKRIENAELKAWTKGNSISKDGITITASEDKVVINEGGRATELSLAPFQIKALADMKAGDGNREWRDAKQYGATRTKVCGAELVIDRQIDWLLHMRQSFKIEGGRILCDISFTAPHPTIIRRVGGSARSFDPRGLDLVIRTGKACKTIFDIPFGITEYTKPGESHFCLLNICALESAEGGLAVMPRTGEQGFSVDADKGEMTLYLGASTVGGPIKDVTLKFITPVNVKQEAAWYLEPFHGTYNHSIIFDTYKGSWSESKALQQLRTAATPIYVRECHASKGGKKAMPSYGSLLESSSADVDVTSAEIVGDKLVVRLNERLGKKASVTLRTQKGSTEVAMQPFGIVQKEL